MAYLEAKGVPLEGKVDPENLFFWAAFNQLRGSRGINGPIPFSEIAAYADYIGLECPVMRGRFAKIITALDIAERTHGAETTA